jgi:tetratricopeptide (TPR) repeat protein
MRLLDILVEAGILGVLLLSPLPFGGALPWAQAALEMLVALTAGAWAVRMAVSGRLAVPRSPLLLPATVMLVLMVLQLLIPGRSVNAYATWESLRLFLAYVVFLIVLGAHLVTPGRIVRLVSAVVAWGVVLAAWGIVSQALGRQPVGWDQQGFSHGRLVSTFTNPNHQALYFVVLLFLALGMLLRPRRRVHAPGVGRHGSAGMSLYGTGFVARVLFGGAVLVLGVALTLTASRGGVAAVLAGVVTISILVLIGRVRGQMLLGLAVSLVAFAGYTAWVGTDALLTRVTVLAREPFADLRWGIWMSTLRVAAEAPIFGVGFGTFEDAVIAYRPAGLLEPYYLEHAHNDYLQLLAEGGAISLMVLAWAAATWLTFVVIRWRDRHDVFVRGFVMGGVGAVTAVAVHSGLDFGLHVPANVFLVISVLTLVPAVVTLRAHRAGLQVDLKGWHRDLAPRLRVYLGVLSTVLVVIAGLALVPAAVADWRQRDAHRLVDRSRLVKGVLTTADLARAERELEAAARLDPWSPRIQKEWADVAAELGNRVWAHGVTAEGIRLRPGTVADRLTASQEYYRVAYLAYQRSLRAEPRVSLTQWRFGWFLAGLEDVRQAVGAAGLRDSVPSELSGTLGSSEGLLRRALHHLQEAVRLDPESPSRRMSLVGFALTHREEVPQAKTIIAQEAREAIRLDRRVLPDVVQMLTLPTSDPDLLWLAVPREAGTLVELASILESHGHMSTAGAALEEAVSISDGAPDQAVVLLARSRFLLRRGDKELALAQARQALTLVPADPESYAVLAEAYDANGLPDEAASAFAAAIARARDGNPQQLNRYRRTLATHLTRRGDLGSAVQLWREAVEALPNDALNHLELAKLLEMRQELAEALREYETARRLGLGTWELQHAVAEAYVRHGWLREAAAATEQALSLNPDHDDLRVKLGDLYLRMGSPERAREQYRIVLTRQPTHQAAARGLHSTDDLPSSR